MRYYFPANAVFSKHFSEKRVQLPLFRFAFGHQAEEREITQQTIPCSATEHTLCAGLVLHLATVIAQQDSNVDQLSGTHQQIEHVAVDRRKLVLLTCYPP
jgi:hypothetical protein